MTTGSEVRLQYKVFIASPDDVLSERQAALDAIGEVNEVLEHIKSPCRLEVYAWERRAHPEAGRAQQVIHKQIPVEACDIFVGIFWMRFGTPTGENRPRDGRPYLSGTEQEVEEAFQAWERSGRRRPVIMLYRKMDPPPTALSSEQAAQYTRVADFFRQCAPDGEHPALYFEFKGKQFQRLLRNHLLHTITDMEQARSQTTALEIVDEQDPLRSWLREANLKAHPFQHLLAENEPELGQYFVSPGRLSIRQLSEEPRPLVVFGPGGSGKTALRLALAGRCCPRAPKSDLLGVELGKEEMERAVESARGSLERLTPHHLVRTIVQVAVGIIQGQADRLARLRKDEWLRGCWDGLQKLAYGEDGGTGRRAAAGEARRRLGDLAAVACGAGFRQVQCLVDQVDQLSVVQGQPETMARLLEPLLSSALREVPGVCFRYFLPTSVQSLLHERHDVFRLDRCRVEHLEWRAQDLQDLIRQRLMFFSQRSFAPYQSLGELCESEEDLSRNIDAELVALAEGRPRAAVWLANRLVDLHCGAERPPRLIQARTWERVKLDWWLNGRLQVFGAPEGREGFRLEGKRIFFREKELRLSARSHRLLACLVQAGGRVCPMEELIRAAWPGESPAGVTRDAVAEAVRRMRGELDKQKVDPTWVGTERGRGYCLRRPEAPPPPDAALRRALEKARRVLAVLEEQAAAYTTLTIPAHLQIELEDQRRQVADLERQLAGPA